MTRKGGVGVGVPAVLVRVMVWEGKLARRCASSRKVSLKSTTCRRPEDCRVEVGWEGVRQAGGGRLGGVGVGGEVWLATGGKGGASEQCCTATSLSRLDNPERK